VSSSLHPNIRECDGFVGRLNVSDGSPIWIYSVGSESSMQLAITELTSPRQSRWEIDYSKLSIEKQIGRGGFGVIYLAKYEMDGSLKLNA